MARSINGREGTAFSVALIVDSRKYAVSRIFLSHGKHTPHVIRNHRIQWSALATKEHERRVAQQQHRDGAFDALLGHPHAAVDDSRRNPDERVA